jgi:hypothetical protein
MDCLFKHLPFVSCYLDDLIIASDNLEEHHEHLRQIFTILQENDLQINPAKCAFAAAVEFLGHRVDQHGVRPLQWHVQAISDFPPPQDVKQLQQFLGLAGGGPGSTGATHFGRHRRCAAGRLFGDGRCAAILPGGGGDDELHHTADHNPGGR